MSQLSSIILEIGTTTDSFLTLWDYPILPKHYFILWLAASGKIKTKDRLEFLEIDHTCVLYKTQSESIQHLFFACPFSSQIWATICSWMQAPITMCCLESAASWISSNTSQDPSLRFLHRLGFASTVYYIWTARNKGALENFSLDR
ncbi:uncharacterized protein LOC127263955 [Andrographis paniculata]|uniref:uncharacterized protein LOC127263955 n=1 Tax=Andrographis paniculata TaxID=175694 RepID=UPI0021E9A92F|nr:uncharacterized protein LOC127263955 [Andrographis paniculata]